MTERIISEQELYDLPLWARVAFAARCARRVQHMFQGYTVPGEQIAAVDSAIELAEQAAAAAQPSDGYRAYEQAVSLRSVNDAGLTVFTVPFGFQRPLQPEFAPAALAAGYAAWAADRADPGGRGSRDSQVYVDDEGFFRVRTPGGGDASAAIFAAYAASVAAERAGDQHVPTAMYDDLQTLKAAAAAEGWNDATPVPLSFFPLRADFSAQLEKNRTQLIEIHSAVTLKLLESVRLTPERLFALSPRAFEELIAQLFTGFGFSVELTSPTRDGGRDLIAIGSGIAQVKYLIECKRYAPHRKVGIAFIQRLHGVVVSDGATKGILATTSDFTKPAKQHIEEHQYILEGRPLSGLLEWLRDYDKLRLKEPR